MKLFVSADDGKKLKKQNVTIFANVSIPNRSVEVPVISDSVKLKKAVYDILSAAHEETKSQLAQMRKAGTAPRETRPVTKKAVPKPLEFDAVQEQQLHKELKKNSKRILDKHFTYIALQDFYYKYRDLDEEYLRKCIKYCLEDIAMLSDIQRHYRKEETERIRALSSVYGKKGTEEMLKAIQPFNGGIPAFYRLAVIYEKRKDIAEAIVICDQAIAYYDRVGMGSNASEFEKRRKKLEDKLQKQ